MGEILVLGGNKGVQETQLKDSLMQRLVHLLKDLNLIGSDGASHRTLPQIDPCQLWAISVAADVLDDAGYGIDGKEFDKARCGVVFANALGGENRNLSNIRVWSEHTLNVAKKFGLPVANSEQFVAELVDGTPRINEDTMPGN